jgi:hypothetical protein
MENYIVTYNFSDSDQNKRFVEEIAEKYPQNQQRNLDSIKYFGFPARHSQSVEDELESILHRFGIGSSDYVALYYTREKDPDAIKRVMILGHDEYLEEKLKNISNEVHQNNLIDLMNYDFVDERARAQKN